MTTGPNERCPCGSGRKYKRCCGSARPSASASPAKGPFEFIAGSYQMSLGFLPSIACLRATDDGRKVHHFVLVRPDPSADRDQADQISHQDLEQAFAGRPAPAELAERLKAVGYARLDQAQIARD
ncbi:MAG: SEC-C metal-binding domain-containing protein [Myxococcales bacterium]